jgi:hypothetical protein
MSKEKQIEEIIEVLNSESIRWGCGDMTDNDIAEALYDAGYRKQSEGEWIFRNDGAYGRTRCYCSACGKHSGIGGIRENQLKPYCPNCGAKMKGGAE